VVLSRALREFGFVHPAKQSGRPDDLDKREAERVIDAAKKHLDALHSIFGDPSGRVAPVAHGGEREAMVRDILRLRRRRQDFFGEGLFSDPAWDILLELYATALNGRRIAATALADVLGTPASTCLRWINKLEQDGWVRRLDDPFDGRRVWIYISDRGLERMDAYFEAWSPRAV
jgi:DNA-binding MarR family transcriptional regulator